MMPGHSPNPIFFDKKDWTLRTLAAPPIPSTSDKDPFLSYPNPNPTILTFTRSILCSKRNGMTATLSISDHARISLKCE